MTTALMQSTQIQFSLTVNVNVNADKTLLFIAGLIALAGYYVVRAGREVTFLWGDFQEAWQFTAKVYTIGFKALIWGIGVKL